VSSGRSASRRVLVADSDPLVRFGIRCILRERDPAVRVCEAAGLDAALGAARTCDPDVIVLDSDLGGRRPEAAIPALEQAAPQARIVVLGEADELDAVRTAFGAGAAAFVLREGGREELERAFAEIEAGARYLDPHVGASLASDGAGTAPETLSDREQRVLELVALGLTNVQIASELGLSVRTIEKARARAQRKRGLRSRADVVAYVRG
jgi:DNA-binding NarL/FixJ family response regulator